MEAAWLALQTKLIITGIQWSFVIPVFLLVLLALQLILLLAQRALITPI
jgi:hypothetical protein